MQCEDAVAAGVHAIVVVVVVVAVVVECSHSDMGHAGCIPAAVDAGRDLEHMGDTVQAKAVHVEAGYRKAAVAAATEAVKCV